MSGKCLWSWRTTWRRRHLASAVTRLLRARLYLPKRLRVAEVHPRALSMNSPLLKRVVAEAVGTAVLLAAVVGSGIMGERLAAGNVALALLANTMATGAALVALILTSGRFPVAPFIRAFPIAADPCHLLAWNEVLAS